MNEPTDADITAAVVYLTLHLSDCEHQYVAVDRRALAAIALRQHAKGLRGREWRKACEEQYLGENDVGNPLIIIGVIQIFLTIIRIYLEWRKP